MDLPALNEGENLIREVPDIFIKSKGYRLFLTTKRVLLIDNDLPDSLQVDVPLSLIKNASAGQNKAGEPVLTLSISSPEAKHRKMFLALPGKNGEARTNECNLLKEAFDEIFSIAGRDMAAPADTRATETKPEESTPTGSSGPENRGKVILESPNIIVKSQEFTAVLTDAKLTLLNTGKKPSTPVEIARGMIHDAKAGYNSAHEPTIELSVLSQDNSVRKMILSFSLWFNGERTAERDQWIKIITGCRPLPPAESINNSNGNTLKSGTTDNSVENSSSMIRYCPECGESVPGDARFCYSCGAKLDGSGRVKRSGSRKKRVDTPKSPKKPGFLSGMYDDCQSIEYPSLTDKYVFFLFGPDRASRLTRTEDSRDALPYLLLVLAIYAVMKVGSLILMAQDIDPVKYHYIAALGSGIFPAISLCIELILLGLAFTLFYCLLLHMGVMIAGGRNSVHETIKTGMYASAPLVFAGIIPLLGEIIAPIWILFIQVAGIRENQELSTGRAVLAAVFPIVILGILIAIMTVLNGGSGA